MDAPLCDLCGSLDSSLQLRPLVPPAFLAEGLFDIDPLGTAGAGLSLCPGCARVLREPMLLAADAQSFARAIALHAEAHPPSSPREALGARARLLHRALHLGLEALVAELVSPPVVAPVRAEPDQLGLFSSRSARLARLLPLLEAGDWAAAAADAATLHARFDLPEAGQLVQLLPVLRTQVEALASDPELFAAGLGELLGPEPPLTLALRAALERGLHLGVASACQAKGRLEVLGRLAGWYWVRAGRADQARASLQAAVDQGVLPGQALVLLGNLAAGEGQLQASRELFRRAFCEDPEGVDGAAVVDAAVAALVDEAAGLELEPPAAWVPLVGWFKGLFWLPPEPQGREPCRAFHQALLAGRKGGVVEARRRMKELAPMLFEELRDQGRL